MSNVPMRSSAVGDSGAGASGGAESRFDALVHAHYARLCNFASRLLGSDEVVEDIVQDVFLAIWQKHVEFKYDDPLPYLYQAVRNRAVMHARRLKVRKAWSDQAQHEGPAVAPGNSVADLEGAELARDIARAIDTLPTRCRMVFTMSREQDLTYGEIAKALGISIKTVEAQMAKALRVLRSQLARHLGAVIALAEAAGRAIA